MFIDSYEDVLKFLDNVSKKCTDQSVLETNLALKVEYHKRAKSIGDARKVLRTLIFEAEDFSDYGKYELSKPVIKEKEITTITTIEWQKQC